MATSKRPPKRARKKERQQARREEWRQAVAKRRRQRWGVFLGSLAVVGIGVLITFFTLGSDPEEPHATPGNGQDETETITAPIKEPVACDAKLPKSAGSKKKTYSKAADQNLDPSKTYLLHLETSCGEIDIELDVKESPKTANSVAFLAREGFYDGLVFHRILKNFVLQGGDPQGTGSGDAGYDVVEPPPDDMSYDEGVVAMAKGAADPPGSSSSQFFIVSGKGGDTLPPDYAYLGKVASGDDAIDAIEKVGHEQDGPPPTEWAYIERATIIEK